MTLRVSLSCFALSMALLSGVAQAQTAPAQRPASTTAPTQSIPAQTAPPQAAPAVSRPAQVLTGEELVVRRVLDDETTAFYANTYEPYAKLWSDAPYVSYTFPVGGNRYQRYLGENVKKRFKNGMTGKATGRTSTKTNVLIRVHGDSASAIYDDEIKDAAGKQIIIYHCQRYLERENGQWKIVSASTFF